MSSSRKTGSRQGASGQASSSRASGPKLTPEQREAKYQEYLAREPPKALGTVDWPTAKPGALEGLKIRATGELETITREDLNQVLRGSSAWVPTGMSKKLDFIVEGRDPGPNKMAVAQEQGIPRMNEQQLHSFLRDRLGP